MASISATPRERAAASTWPKMASISTGIGATDPDFAEARGARAMACAHYLLRLPLAAIGHSPKRPMLRPGNGRAGVPKFRRNAAVAGVLQHSHPLAIADLPADLAAELKMVALIVNRPAPVGFHINRMLAIEHFIERLFSRLEAHVGHADEREARPAVGAHAAVRALFAHTGRGFARGHVAFEPAVPDNV